MALVFGKYEKIRRIAQGGMGEVFLARQTGVLDRLAILKALRLDLAKEREFVEQFLDEARVAATLNHPNIVAIYDVGEWHSTYYIAMEYIAGEDLSKLWYAAAKAGIGLPFQVSVRIIMEAAMGLDHAHRAKDVRGQPLNIVHRDVSPQNLMVRADGVTKLVDFGIAKAANKSSRTQAGMVKGKLQYMSPEQVRGEPLDGRSDQFSLGIVLWEMCTGRRLFKADTEINTLQKILQTPIPRPTQHVPGFPAELEAVIMRMLERDPDKRFASLNEVAQKLKDYLDRSSVASGETGVAAFVQQILGKELDARIADLTPMEPTEASLPPSPPPKKTETKKPTPQPLFDAVDDDDDIDEPTAVLAPEQRPDRHTRPTVDNAASAGLESLAVGPRGEWVVRRVDGKVVHFTEWAALQQHCLEGKLGRDDQVSPDGRRFTRLGDDVVLARFFDAAPAPKPAPRPAPVPVDPAPSPVTATNQRAAVVDTLPVGDVISVDVSATDAVPVVVVPANGAAVVPANVVAGSQADPFGGPVDPFNPNATSAFSLGTLPSTPTGAWQFNGNMAALQASAVAGSSTTAPTTTAPPPKKRAPVALWAALGVGMSLVVIGVGLRVLAPDTMAAILGERQQVPSFARTTAALTVIHSDEPAAIDAMQKELAPLLSADAVDVDVLVAGTLLAAERARISAAAAAVVGRGSDADATDAAGKQLATDRAAAGILRERLAPLSSTETAEGRQAKMALAIASALPPATTEQLAPLATAGGDDVALTREATTWAALSTTTTALSTPSPTPAGLDGVTTADDDRRAAGLRVLLDAIAASDDASKANARRAVITRQQRSPSDVRLSAALALLDASTPVATTEKPEKPTKPDATKPPEATKPAETTTTTTTTEPAPPPPPETYETAYAKGSKAQRAGRSKEALKLLTTALELKPGDVKATLSMAWTQIDLGRTEAALKSFRSVLEKQASPEAQFGVGEALRAMGRTTDAIAAFEKYLELAPNGPDAETAKNAISALQ